MNETDFVDMRLLLSIFLLPLLPFSTYGQKSMTFQEAQREGIFEKLDKQYPGGISEDSSKAIFKNQTQYLDAHQSFIAELGKYLKENGFQWGKPIRCFNKIYFSKTGRVDYFLYNFQPGDLTAEQASAFSELLAGYVQNAQFKLTAPTRFAQCSPVKYTDILCECVINRAKHVQVV